eukprot:TRINITY_DN1202_c0_g1_i4.p1 TRINITY_DN1202_c0_g1~~TRINITY_DN1202_c0_g1_i4.p1  ORF type:complete len:266 (-),score=53.84 TRINITY_DN1202_c0_g1_i4:70-867(-)
MLAAVAVMHLGALPLLLWYPSNPSAQAAKPESSDEPAVEVSSLKCFAAFRYQLPAATLMNSALLPFLPLIMEHMAVPVEYQTLIASIWLFSRAVTFAVMYATRFWRSTLASPLVSSSALLVGFVACLSSLLLPRWPGLPLLIAALLVFGIGWGIVYDAGLVYSFEVGTRAVSSGAFFEFSLALGNVSGPAVCLASFALKDRGVWALPTALGVVVSVVTLTSAALVAAGFWSAYLTAAASPPTQHPSGLSDPTEDTCLLQELPPCE